MNSTTIIGRGAATTTRATVHAAHIPDIWYELSDPPSDLENHDFVLWTLLPLAMFSGADLRIEGRISERARSAGEKVSNLWEKWNPLLFSRVNISADEVFDARKNGGRRLMFFSGGVDSTYSAFRDSEERQERRDCLIIHGLDYRYDNLTGFENLLTRTKPLRERLFDRTLTSRTNVGDVYFRHYYHRHVARSFGYYAMFASSALLPDYSEIGIAADLRLDQQIWNEPVGNNTANLSLMKSANADMIPLHDDVTRTEKTAHLLKSDLDISLISICPDKSVQPQNCGRCEKCYRTKVVLYLFTGDVPVSFIDRTVDENWADNVDVERLSQAVFLADILTVIEDKGDPHSFPGYAKAREKYLHRCERLYAPSIYNMPWKASAKYLLPKRAYRAMSRIRGLFR